MMSISADIKFKVGQRVILSPEGRKQRICSRSPAAVVMGTVVDVHRSHNVQVSVKPDGYKQAQDYHVDFWSPIGEVCPKCSGTGYLAEVKAS